MPELPEVEGFRAFLERHAAGKRIERAEALDDLMLKDTSRLSFARRLRGHEVGSVVRRGKIVIASTRARPGEKDPPALALHFGMTGHLLAVPAAEPVHRWDRLLLTLDHGMQIRYRNMRRLGFIRLPRATEVPDLLWPLGPDPLEAPESYVRESLARRRAPVKAVLLDQSFLAGLGNIYADEALFVAGIRPDRRANSLAAADARRLHRAVVRVLRPAVAANVREPMSPLNTTVPRRRSDPCPRCGRGIESATVGGRTAYYCARCQR